MAKAKSVTLNEEQSQKLLLWQQKQEQCAAIKAEEFALRMDLVANAGFDPSKLEGSQTLDIGNGWKLKATKNQNYKLSNANQEAQNLLATIAKAGHVDIAQGLVKWEPEMSTKVYRELLAAIDAQPNEEIKAALKAALAAALTIKPGAPQLELVPPDEASNA